MSDSIGSDTELSRLIGEALVLLCILQISLGSEQDFV